jgi:hypothetical protein
MREKEERRMDMKLWIDDVRPAPEGYEWYRSVNDAKYAIKDHEKFRLWLMERQEAAYEDGLDEYAQHIDWLLHNEWSPITVIDIDHDSGEYFSKGGDYIKLLDWLEETGRNYPIRIHSANAVGIANMRRIIQRNGWKEVF